MDMTANALTTACTPRATCSTAASRRWSDLARAVGLSASHLQRRFRARFGLSPAEYLAQRKLGTLKAALREGSDVSAALYDAGYGSPSRVYEAGAARLGMTPARYRAGGAGESIRWSIVDTALGTALVAATERGICMVELGEDAAALEAKLRRRIPAGAAAARRRRPRRIPRAARARGGRTARRAGTGDGRRRPDRHRLPEEASGMR